jgi:predicted nucleic acid-binding protein
LNLLDYSHSDPIFIDANIFLDYALPNPIFGEIVAEFLEKVELEEISAVTTPAVLSEVSQILLFNKGFAILRTQNRNLVKSKIKADSRFSRFCYDTVDKFNGFITGLEGLKLVPVQPEDYLMASDLGRNYRLLSLDALHLSVMRHNHIRNIATRDHDFERVDGIALWSP